MFYRYCVCQKDTFSHIFILYLNLNIEYKKTYRENGKDRDNVLNATKCILGNLPIKLYHLCNRLSANRLYIHGKYWMMEITRKSMCNIILTIVSSSFSTFARL